MNHDRNLLLADAHVHIYDCYNLLLFFESAFMNFKNAAASFGYFTGYTPLLLLTEGRNERWFERLLRMTDEGKRRETEDHANHIFARTQEPISLSVKKEGLPPLFLIAGRQIVTEEKLEVLALATVSEIPDGLSIDATFDSIAGHGGIPVLPWGFGKWMGKRRKILNAFLEKKAGNHIFLGDNSGRPAFLSTPPQFNVGWSNGIRVLPGSDPLPIPSECHKPGSFGFAIPGSVDPDKPGDDIRKRILDPLTRPSPYGLLETIPRFFKNQTLMQIWKRKKPSFPNKS